VRLISSPTGSPGSIRTIVCESVAELEPWLDRWDALAVDNGMPMAAPTFALAWWESFRTPRSRLAVVVVEDDDGLVGLAPFVALNPRLVEYRLLGAGVGHRLGPIARRGSEELLGRQIVAAFAGVRLHSVVFEGVDGAGAVVAETVAAEWPGRLGAQLRADVDMVSPVATLAPSHADWMAAKSQSFRRQEKQGRRALDGAGMKVRRSESRAEIAADLTALGRLHLSRTGAPGDGSAGWDDEPVLQGFLRTVPSIDRVWLYVIEHEGRVVAANLAVGAGAEITGVAVGHDGEYDRLRPGYILMNAMIADACAAGVARFDLGGGGQQFKARFADEERTLRWMTVYPRTHRWLVVRARLAPKHLRYAARAAARKLPDKHYRRLKNVAQSGLGRLRRNRG
jgi:CelD/BcsL family acetyltransferase involved in cellulose biosynthesis